MNGSIMIQAGQGKKVVIAWLHLCLVLCAFPLLYQFHSFFGFPKYLYSPINSILVGFQRYMKSQSLKAPNGNPLQYSCLENPMDGGAWQAAVHGVAKNRTRLNNFTFTFRFHALEEEMATHSSVLAWRIPGTGEPGGLPSLGSHRIGHD